MRKNITRYTDTLRNGDRKQENASNFLASKRLNAWILEKSRRLFRRTYYKDIWNATKKQSRTFKVVSEATTIVTQLVCFFNFFFFLDEVHVTQETECKCKSRERETITRPHQKVSAFTKITTSYIKTTINNLFVCFFQHCSYLCREAEPAWQQKKKSNEEEWSWSTA